MDIESDPVVRSEAGGSGLDLAELELDLSSIDALDGTALGQILKDLYRTGPGAAAEDSPLGRILGSSSSHTSFSSHNSFSSFSSYSGPDFSDG
ncbi:hypothetical protein [Embleya sp. NPDC005575]|uniref:hypothetical protein n=1 Tax=Embleya sp. NPDC005575 TaxID=3156892 RepID=UPI0033A87C83